MLVPSPATRLASLAASPCLQGVIELCLQTQLSLALALSCPARGCTGSDRVWIPAANREPGCQPWTNERP